MKYLITERQYKLLTENNGFDNNFIKNQKRLREYIKILKENPELDNIDYYIQYFIILHNFLHLEDKYSDLVKLSNKELNKYLNLPKLKSLEDVINKFYDLYDINSKVRFAVETMNSIGEIDDDISKYPKFFNKIYYNI